jgi:hypothetical protein
VGYLLLQRVDLECASDPFACVWKLSALVDCGALGDHRKRTQRAQRMGLNDLTEKIVGAAIDVHRELGPGLLESTYEACMLFELAERGLSLSPKARSAVDSRHAG